MFFKSSTTAFDIDFLGIEMKPCLLNIFRLAPLIFIAACGGHASIQSSEKSASHNQSISNLLVVIDESHLRRAFTFNKQTTPFSFENETEAAMSAEERVAARNARANEHMTAQKKAADLLAVPASALKDAFVSALANRKIQVEGQVVNTDRNKLGLAMLATQFQQKHVLFVNVNDFEKVQPTLNGSPMGPTRWSGRISWDMRLVDREKLQDFEGKPAWKAKTDFFLFGPAECRYDAFKACSERFVASVIKQMSKEGLLLESGS